MPASTSKSVRRAALAVTLGAGAFAALPTAASAAGTNACDASALQLSILGGEVLNPIHANPAYTPCLNGDGALVSIPSLLNLVSVDAVTASTRNVPNAVASAETEVVGAKVGSVGPVIDSLTGPLLSGPNSITGTVDGALTGLLGPLTAPGGLLNGLLGNVPLVGGIVIGGINSSNLVGGLAGSLPTALQAALPSVLETGVISSSARVTCVNGNPQLSGASRIADLKVLGVGVDANSAAEQVLSIDTASLNLGQLISPTQLLQNIQVTIEPGLVSSLLITALGGNPLAPFNTNVHDLLYANSGVVGLVNDVLAGLTGQTVGSIVIGLTNGLQPLLDSVQINLPPGLLRAQVTPNSQSVVGDQLTQRTLHLAISALEQPILSGTLAQSRVGAGAPNCQPVTPPPPPTPPTPPTPPGVQNPDRFSSPEAEAFLQCSRRPVDLIDVYGTGGRTFIQGVTERKYVGKTATIFLAEGRKRVGTVKVGADGLFTTRVALPPSKIRRTNKARYYAVVDGKRTRALKFHRRMETRGLTATTKTVTFRGRVVGPLQRRQQPITIKQRVGCKSFKTVATVRPDSKGRFTVKVDAPEGESAVIYRAQTRVGFRRNASRLSPTFTLPRVIGLR